MSSTSLLRAACLSVALAGLVGCDCGPAVPVVDAGDTGGGPGGGTTGGGTTGGGATGGGMTGGGMTGGGTTGGGTTGGGTTGGGTTGGGGSTCVDTDGDGFGTGASCAGPDCDDNDNMVHPGAAERCNGADDNCNAQTDEGLVDLTCGVGACARTTVACVNGVPQTCTPGLPGSETCNGVDDDCNGTIDDGPAGQAVACMTGAVGVCAPGLTQCSDGGVVCAPLVSATGESCNGLDDNCDGVPDENNPDGGVSCDTGQLGACQSGVTLCADGGLSCAALATPINEACNNIDDNCDGVADDGNPDSGVACDTGNLGICAAGLTTCADGGVIACAQRLMPGAETCNGLDDNCNGSTDEGNPGSGAACSTGVPGLCATGVTNCVDAGVECTQTVFPVPEVCNSLDDNCNGTNDEGNPGGGAACSTGQLGRCAAGTTNCNAGAISCTRNQGPTLELCNGIDDDCDGTVDNGNPGGGASCMTGLLGVCAAGQTSCSGGAVVCNALAAPSPEVCDGLDNNCNGAVDEGNPQGGISCSTGQLGVCAAGTTACSSGAVVCNRNQNPSPETCNGRDDNCNGTTDEGNPGGGGACNTGLQGVCAAGTLQCSGGGLGCFQNVSPSPETCDGLDNNCNGSVDEGNPGGGVACNTGQAGVCAAGTTACVSGAVACNRNQNPSTETCDSLDNDCDGQVDNNPVAPDGKPNACSLAGNSTVNVGIGGQTSVTGFIDASGDDYFVVNFTGVGGVGTAYHPQIIMTNTAGGQFIMEVLTTTCSGPVAACSLGVTTWEMNYPANPNFCQSFGNCTDNVAKVTSVIVRVRRTGGTPNCSQYTVQIRSL